MQIDILQILFQLINFGIVVGALTFLMYKPILKTLQRRAEKVAASQKAADELIKEREEIEQIKKKESAKAKQEAAKLMNEAKEQVDEKKQELLKKAKEEVKAYVADEKAKWDKEKVNLKKSMEKEFTQAVFTVTEKLVGRADVIDTKTHGKLIDQSIDEVLKAI